MRSPVVAAILICSLVAGCTGFLVGRVSAAPRTGQERIVSGVFDRTSHWSAPAPSGVPSPGGAPLPAAVLQPSLEESVPAIEAGVASWYDDGPGLYAAVPGYRWGDPRYAITVCRQDRPGVCVTVTVRDACGCPGARIVDLSPTAFSRLAPLSAGLVRVHVTTGGAAPTLPATEVSP